MDLTVRYQIAGNQTEAYQLACEQITDDYVAKFNVKTDIVYDSDGKKIEAKGKGFTLSLSFEEDLCRVSLDLSFLLKPLKNKILEAVERKLKKHI